MLLTTDSFLFLYIEYVLIKSVPIPSSLIPYIAPVTTPQTSLMLSLFLNTQSPFSAACICMGLGPSLRAWVTFQGGAGQVETMENKS